MDQSQYPVPTLNLFLYILLVWDSGNLNGTTAIPGVQMTGTQVQLKKELTVHTHEITQLRRSRVALVPRTSACNEWCVVSWHSPRGKVTCVYMSMCVVCACVCLHSLPLHSRLPGISREQTFMGVLSPELTSPPAETRRQILL